MCLRTLDLNHLTPASVHEASLVAPLLDDLSKVFKGWKVVFSGSEGVESSVFKFKWNIGLNLPTGTPTFNAGSLHEGCFHVFIDPPGYVRETLREMEVFFSRRDIIAGGVDDSGNACIAVKRCVVLALPK